MGKFTAKLSRKERDELLFEFFHSLGTMRGVDDVAKVFEDLTSRQELEMLAKRLKIAKLLLEDKTYEDIRKTMKVSEPTIARVSSWLQHSGDGFRLLHERSKSQGGERQTASTGIRRRYPLYYWPQLLVQELVRSATERQKARLYQVIDNLEHKTKMYKDLKRLLAQGRY